MRLNAFYLLLVTDLSGGYALPYDAEKPSRKLQGEEFFISRRFSCERDEAAVIRTGDGETEGGFDSGSRDEGGLDGSSQVSQFKPCAGRAAVLVLST